MCVGDFMKLTKKIKKILHSEEVKRFSKKVKTLFKKSKTYINKNKYILWMALPFILMEVFTFIFGLEISYVNYRVYAPVLFTTCWILLFIGISLSFKKVFSKIIYVLFVLLFLIVFLGNNIYFSLTSNFFDFSLMESASEGAPYLWDTIKNCNLFVYVCAIIIVITAYQAVKRIPRTEKFNFKLLGVTLVLFAICHSLVPLTLGKANEDLTWSSWKNPRNIYILFNDNNKSMKITGLFEYTARNFYITYLKKQEELTQEDIDFLAQAFEDSESVKNANTGIFKDKNLVIIQLEGMDSWIINKNDTPTLYSMMNSGYNFTNHYSFYTGGGSTFNSEFAVNTGFITPLSYTKNAYQFNKNEFPHTMANLFKEQGYSVNAFHMNDGEYYSRRLNYKNWGYDNYYGLKEDSVYTDYKYELDRELILNENFNNLLFNQEGKFVHYIISYSNHTPFTNTKGVCKMLYNLDNEQLLLDNPELEIEPVEMTEEECARRQAQETDYMVQLLKENLEAKDLLKDTVFVLFADHYLYTLEDKTILDKYKNTSNNLINNTPFFIWSPNTKKLNINKTTSQLNILPTILNLFGIKYNPNNYIGQDALGKDYNGIVFFSDYSWYDGNVYVSDGVVTNNKTITQEQLEIKNDFVSYVAKKNDLALQYNYFKNKDEKK